jgi:hypothetical protein
VISAADPFLEIRYVEVNQQTDSLVTESQVCHELRFVDRKDGLCGFHLDDHGIRNQQIYSISELERESVILDG